MSWCDSNDTIIINLREYFKAFLPICLLENTGIGIGGNYLNSESGCGLHMNFNVGKLHSTVQ